MWSAPSEASRGSTRARSPNLSKKQRMPDEEIKTILVDRHDTLWIGTARNGLCRQRGKDFEVLNQTSGLLSGRITTLFEDREGSLLIGTSCGLNRLRRQGHSPGRTRRIGCCGSALPGEGTRWQSVRVLWLRWRAPR